MKNNKKLLSKFLTIILSTMMIFSSVFAYGVLAETKYNAEFLNEENEVIASVSFADVDELLSLIPEEQTKEHYNFDGWYYGEQLLNEEIDISALEEGETITLVPSYSNITHTLNIHYYLNNKFRNTEFRTVNEAEEIEIEAETLRGRIFDKWALDENGENILSEEQKLNITVLEDTELYAFYSVDSSLTTPLTATKTYTVRFYKPNKLGGFTVDKTLTKKVDANEKIPQPENPTNPYSTSDTFYGWYERKYFLGKLLSETQWDFNQVAGETRELSTIDLYPKYISTTYENYEETFDFKVNNGNGTFVYKDPTTGEKWSYYSYYVNEDNCLIATLIKDIKSAVDFSSKVKNYNYVMNDGQVTLDEDGNVTAGQYYTGTAFDIAIQEASSDKVDTIVLLKNMYIVKPIELWADIDLDLNGKTITFNEYGVGLDLLHFIDSVARKSDLIIAKDICATIYINNSNVKVYNGTINNLHASGKGILSTTEDKHWQVSLSNLEVNVKENQNAVESGYYAYDDGGNITGLTPGFTTILSGNYNGYLKNNGDEGYLKINSGEIINDTFVNSQFTKDPRYLKSGVASGVTIDEGYQVWTDGTGSYKYSVDVESEAYFDISDTEIKDFRTLKDAIESLDQSKDNVVYLAKDIKNPDYEYQLSYAKTYTIYLDGHSLSSGNSTIGGKINIANGNVTLTGNGYVKSTLECSGGNLYIEDGYYSSIVKSGTGNIKVSGGYFVEPISEELLANGYVCISSDMGQYPYCVVKADEVSQVQLYKNNVRIIDTEKTTATETHYLDELFPTISYAVNAINYEAIDADEVRLSRDIVVNSEIYIEKPITLNLNNHKIYSNVQEPDEYGYYTSVCIQTPKDSVVTIENGTIDNGANAGKNGEVYGILVLSGDVNATSFTLLMNTVKCKNLYGLFIDGEESTVNLNSSRITGAAIDVDSVFVYNNGTLNVNNSSAITALGSSLSKGIVAISNYNKLNINGGSITASTSYTDNSDAIGIESYGNIDFNGGIVTVNSNDGAAIGIDQLCDDNIAKTITMDNKAQIAVTKHGKSDEESYGIYVESLGRKKGATTVLLGDSKITVNSEGTCHGIYLDGGKVIAGQNNGSVYNGIYKGDDRVNPDAISDNNIAYITIKGGDDSTGITCAYKGAATEVSQLTNTYINMLSNTANLVGSDVYCILSTTTSVGVEVLNGYYRSVARNDLVTTNVKLKGGYYTKDVTDYLANNYKCTPCNVQYKDYLGVEQTFTYTINGSDCKLSVIVENDEELKVKVTIKYDPMFLDPNTLDQYGIEFILGSVEDGLKTYDWPLSETIKQLGLNPNNVTSDTAFTYTFNIAPKNMGDNIAIRVVKFDNNKNPVHTYHIKSVYSVEQYYYNMLLPANQHGEAMRDLAAATLNFGAYAQLYFNYHVDRLVNERIKNNEFVDRNNIPYSVVVNADQSLTYQAFESEELKSMFNSTAYSLILNGGTTLRYSFNVIASEMEGYTNINDAFTFKYNGEVLTVNYDETKGLYYVDINGISASEIGDRCELEIIKNKDSSSYAIKYSPVDYIVEINKHSTSQDAINLMNSLYQYYLIAKTFN